MIKNRTAKEGVFASEWAGLVLHGGHSDSIPFLIRAPGAGDKGNVAESGAKPRVGRRLVGHLGQRSSGQELISILNAKLGVRLVRTGKVCLGRAYCLIPPIPTGFLAGLGQGLEEILAIDVIEADILLAIASAHQVIDRARVLDSELPGRSALSLPETGEPSIVNILCSDPFVFRRLYVETIV